MGPGGAVPARKIEAADALGAIAAANGPTLDGTEAMVASDHEARIYRNEFGQWNLIARKELR